MNLQKTELSQYTESLEGFRPELSAIKARSVIEFFTLRGKTTSMVSSNVIPISDLQYCIFSPLEKRYYLKTAKGYDLDTLFFYRPNLTFSGEDVSVEQLRSYVQDGNVWLLFNEEQIGDMTSLLERLWKSRYNEPGKLDYRTYVGLLKTSLEYEDYKDYGKSLVGFMTVKNQYERAIRELWDKGYAKGKKT